MRKTIGVFIGLGLIAFGLLAVFGQANVAERSGNIDDFYAGIVMGGALAFAGLVTLFAVLRKPKRAVDTNEVQASLWAAGMTTLSNGDDN